LNINADEIVTYMVQHYSDKINEILFLSDQPGLLNKNKKLVSVILKSNIENILAGRDEHIEVD
jgi:acetylglutamate kinase